MNRTQTVETLKNKLDEWNHDIDALVAKADAIQAQGKAEYQQTLLDLRRKQANVTDQLEQVEKASDAAFEDMRGGLEKSWETAAESFRKAVKRYN